VPSKPVSLLLLGGTPLLMRALPQQLRPDPASLPQGLLYGASSMILLLLTGVSGPLVDTFFLGGSLDRREIVATKAVCQVFGHAAKLLYFGGLVSQSASLDPLVAAHRRLDAGNDPGPASAGRADQHAISPLG